MNIYRTVPRVCPLCRGKGYVSTYTINGTHLCEKCGGAGLTQRKEVVFLSLIKGVWKNRSDKVFWSLLLSVLLMYMLIHICMLQKDVCQLSQQLTEQKEQIKRIMNVTEQTNIDIRTWLSLPVSRKGEE